jgi:hypothetical protein
MDHNTQVAVIVIVVAAVAIATWYFLRLQQRQALVRKYGPEYHRLVRDEGGARKAERELEAREKRVKRFELHDLTLGQRERYLSEWNRIQALFVDQPAGAVNEAHALLMAVVRDRGYPEADLEQRQRDLSVHYPQLIEPYREACEIAQRRDAASTEDMRRATICYRSLLNALLNAEPDARAHTRQYETAS